MCAESTNWHIAAKAYLARLGQAEWEQQKRPRGGKGRGARAFQPSDYHRELIECLNQNNEERFKALKALQGYASALGV